MTAGSDPYVVSFQTFDTAYPDNGLVVTLHGSGVTSSFLGAPSRSD